MLALRLLLRAIAFSILVAFACGRSLSEGLVNDREALLSLKNAISDYGQSKVSSWRPTGNPCYPKAWRHVLCGGGRVMEINLSNRQISGFLPGKLRLAERLAALHLDGNRFTGGLPRGWADRTSFPFLRVLNLANNELVGNLPNWNRAGAWRSLQVVDLSNNNFYGGLPDSWLGKQRVIRNVQFLDLSNNHLGRGNGSVGGMTLGRAQWCKNEEAAGLYSGSGWCPSPGNTPIVGTTASLLSLDLSNNGLTGAIPERWPFMFPQLEYLMMQFNSLSKQVDSFPVASTLPPQWTSARRRGFLSLSILTLYPGNDYLCSVPDIDGGFLNVNTDATYQVSDTAMVVYNNENPWLCPTSFNDDNPPTTVTFTKTATSWVTSYDVSTDIWGFKLSIWAEEREGETWSPISGWNAVLLRTYTAGDDGFSAANVADQGLSCTAGGCTLTFADLPSSDGRLSPPVFSWELSRLQMYVSVFNLDGVESSQTASNIVAN